MASILQPYNRDECFFCGGVATDTHHVFYGAGLRDVSERFGLTVRLCRLCHTEGPEAVHKDRNRDLELKEWAQEKAMAYYSWDTDEWRYWFRKSYLDEPEKEHPIIPPDPWRDR